MTNKDHLSLLESPIAKAHQLMVSEGTESLIAVLLATPQAACPVYHRFGPGLYIREVSIPAGTMAVGHHQKFEHLNVFLKGRVVMFNENGTTTELAAPMLFVGQPGRKVGYILEDMVWQNIYATEERDVEKLEEIFLDKTEQWTQSEAQLKSMQHPEHAQDRTDYSQVLQELGLTEDQARTQFEHSNVLHLDNLQVQVGNSSIEGKGLFASAGISIGQVIATARVGNERTIAGRYTNHSMTPNAGPEVLPNGDIVLIALRDIHGCRGGQLGDEITLDYRQSIKASKLSDLMQK